VIALLTIWLILSFSLAAGIAFLSHHHNTVRPTARPFDQERDQ
jgi:hypothetical protein